MSSFINVLKPKIGDLIARALLAYVVARLRAEAGRCSSVKDLVERLLCPS